MCKFILLALCVLLLSLEVFAQPLSCGNNFFHSVLNGKCCSCSDFNDCNDYDLFSKCNISTCPSPFYKQKVDDSADCFMPYPLSKDFICCACSAGKYLSSKSDGGSCLPCADGFVSNAMSLGCHKNCSAGTGINGEDFPERDKEKSCTNCVGGDFNDGSGKKCFSCFDSNYGTYGGTTCSLCPIGRLSYTVLDYSNTYYHSCEAYGFLLDPLVISILILVLYSFSILPMLSLIFYCDSSSEFSFRSRIGILLGTISYTFLPTMTFLFNLAYILENAFLLPESIYANLIPPCVVLLVILWVNKATPAVWLCPMPKSWTENEELDSLHKLIPHALIFFINLPLYVLWFVVGLWLYLTKALAVGCVRDTFFRVWSGVKNEEKQKNLIDAQLLNFIILCQIVFEAFPMLVLEIVDPLVLAVGTTNKYLSFREIAYICGGLSILTGIYRVLYFKIYKNINLLDVPLSCKLPFISDFFPASFATVSSTYSYGRVDGEEDLRGTGTDDDSEAESDIEGDKGHNNSDFKHRFNNRIREVFSTIASFIRSSYTSCRNYIVWISKERKGNKQNNVELGNRQGKKRGKRNEEKDDEKEREIDEEKQKMNIDDIVNL